MDPRDLVKVWDAPDHSRLTPKQISIRLPMLVAAKINALCELYPRKSKTEVIGDLLATALDQLEEGMPSQKGRIIDEYWTEPDPLDPNQFPGRGDVYEDVGLKGRFRSLVAKHLREMEKEAGIAEPWPVPDARIYEDG